MQPVNIWSNTSFPDPDTGDSALHVACALNYDAIVTKLLVLGASTAVQDTRGMTPVMTACSYGHQQALEALASKGMDASSKRELRPGFY